MHPIHVELSPGSDQKRRPVLSASLDRVDYIQRASRDAYYFDHTDSSHNARMTVTARPSPAASMMEVELDAILRGNRSAWHPNADAPQHDSLEKRRKVEPYALLPSQEPLLSSATERRGQRQVLQHLREFAVFLTPVDGSRGRRSAMQHSIERFLRASEDRDGEGQEDAGCSDGVPASNSLAMCVDKPQTQQITGGGDGEAGTGITSALSRALFNTVSHSARKGPRCPSADQGHSSPPLNTTAASKGRKEAANATHEVRVLQSLSVNTVPSPVTPVASKRSSVKRSALDASPPASPSPTGAASSQREEPDSSGAPVERETERLLEGVQVSMMCAACQLSVRVFAFFPASASSTASVAFCPFCGGRCADQRERRA